MTRRSQLYTFLLVIISSSVFAFPKGFNYEESQVPEYELPDPLVLNNGDRVADADAWQHKRRAEIVDLFETQVYGRVPAGVGEVRFGEVEVDEQALDGLAIRKQVKMQFSDARDGPTADLLIYLPAGTTAPTPIFIGLNFGGNHTIVDDPGVWLTSSWLRDSGDGAVVDHRATELGRGKAVGRWPVREILARGYAVATIYCGDIDPDDEGNFQNGVHRLFYQAGQDKPAPDEWGALAAWAWGLSRAMDYFELDEDVDASQAAVLGHSRLGKAALWAGARDERFAMVISNESGCGGAALSRRRFGETVKQINTRFPHWFCDNFQQYNDNEDALPVDQHMLAALIAPRSLYVASAEKDLWSDPRGEFLSLKLAAPVFELMGKTAITDLKMPPVDQPIMRDAAYHVRSGGHDLRLYDWQRFMDFADRQFDRE